jgi:hypothetical protein
MAFGVAAYRGTVGGLDGRGGHGPVSTSARRPSAPPLHRRSEF